MPVYTVKNSTVGAAAPKTQIQIAAAANARVKVRGFLLGNISATAAQGVRFELNRQTTDGTATSATPAPVNPDSIAARTGARSTYTAEPTVGTVIPVDIGFDIIGTYILWFPPDTEPQAVNAGRIGLRKVTGVDTSVWAATLFFEE